MLRLMEWFDEEGRPWPWRATRERWCILVAEVCLQQTQVSRAAGHVERILDRFPTPQDLARAPLGELLALWQGLGYPRRARNLWLAAQQVCATGWPADYRELPGVGPYTAAALQCFADELPVLPADINTRRVMERLFGSSPPTHADEPLLSQRPWTWGQAVMELGQRACRARANCAACPLLDLCPSAGTTEVFASPRQARYEGSLRQRRGSLLRQVNEGGSACADADPEAARTLVADGLAASSRDGRWLLPPGS